MRSATFCGVAIAAALIAGFAACGSDAGKTGWEGRPVDAGRIVLDLDGAYPTADPDPEGGTRAGPTFDAGEGGAVFTCIGKKASSGDSAITLQSGGLARTFYVHVPPSYDPTRGAMLVLNFHGFTNAALIQKVISRMDASADAHGYIAVYPEGVATSWNAGDCCGTAWNNAVDDVAFVKTMLTRLESDWCVDPKRMFATGYSNGGFLSYRLACEMADAFAAIAPVAGEMGIDATKCKPSRPVPVLDFHGTSDPIVPYNGGVPLVQTGMGLINFRSTAETISVWRDKDGCLGAGKVIYQQGDTTCTRYDTCKMGSEVVHCKIDGGGHTWPGGVPVPLVGKTSTDISATETMVKFFEAHPLP